MLNQQLFEPVVLSFTEGSMVEVLKERGVKTYVIRNAKPFNILLSKRIQRILRNENIQLVHSHGTKATSNALLPVRSLKLPHIYTVHGWSFHPGLSRWQHRLRVRLEQYLTDRVDRTICVSHAIEKEAKELFLLKNSAVIPCAVDLHKFAPERVEENGIKRAMGIPDGKTVVGYVVRMTLQKDPMTFYKAIRIAAKEEENLHFVWVGDGEFKEKIIGLATKEGLRDRITFEDFRQDVPAVLAMLDLYILPSLWEGLPIGLLEAMAMKKAVVVSDIGPNCELIDHGYNGLTMPVGDAEALADQILSLHRNPYMACLFGERARKLVQEKYTIEQMAASVGELYFDTLAKCQPESYDNELV
ncbi:MAG: glycosyltransferase [Cytophagales bacterium]|nr:glycosyltransferase [Cytophagales bacterium]